MNEKLVESQNAQIEVVKFQALCDELNRKVSTEKNRIDTTHDPLIQKATNDLDTAKKYESEKYSEYIILNNKMNDLIHERGYYKDLADSHAWNLIAVVMDITNMNIINEKIVKLTPTLSNAWLKYLDSQTLRETEERDYNSALLAKQNDSRVLDQLERELIAATSSLNTWKIAYQAAVNVYNGLTVQLAELKAQIR